MTNDSPELTRRKLLGAVAGTGALGATTGVTASQLVDRESSSISIQAGGVSLEISCGSCSGGNNGVDVGIDSLEPGTGGSEEFDISVEGNPSRLWVKTACPPVVDPLGDALEVTALTFQRNDDATTLFSGGSLTELRDEFSGGTRLDNQFDDGNGDDDNGACLFPADEVTLELDYELPDDADWTADLTTELSFDFFAEQCRAVEEDEVEDPFATATEECRELDCPDSDCIEFAKFEPQGRGNNFQPGTYDVDELYAEECDVDVNENEYELEVLTVTQKADGDTVGASFRLLKGGREQDAPPLCKADIRGGPSDEPGPASNVEGIDPPTTRTRGELFTAESATPAEAHGISHITVWVCCSELEGDSE